MFARFTNFHCPRIHCHCTVQLNVVSSFMMSSLNLMPISELLVSTVWFKGLFLVFAFDRIGRFVGKYL